MNDKISPELELKLKLACESGDTSTVRQILNTNINLDMIHFSLLRASLLNGHIETFNFIKQFLSQRSTVDEESDYWDFISACKENNVQVVKAYILQNYLKKSRSSYYDPFYNAFNLEAFDVCDLLLASGVNIEDHSLLLHSFIVTEIDLYKNWQAEGIEIEPESVYLKYLVSRGANVNQIMEYNGRYVTPLDLAIEGNHQYAIELLKVHGAKRSDEIGLPSPEKIDS